jgi:hypothetical protein
MIILNYAIKNHIFDLIYRLKTIIVDVIIYLISSLKQNSVFE